jgi:hypothetical protein
MKTRRVFAPRRGTPHDGILPACRCSFDQNWGYVSHRGYVIHKGMKTLRVFAPGRALRMTVFCLPAAVPSARIGDMFRIGDM